MAITVRGVNNTLINAPTAPNEIDPEMVGAKVKWIYDSYEASALAANAVIAFGPKLPAGARIVDWIIDHDALAGAAVTFRFGTLEDDDEFMTDTDCFAVDKKNMTDDGVTAQLGFEITAGDGQTLIITTSGASAANGTIKVAVAYTAK